MPRLILTGTLQTEAASANNAIMAAAWSGSYTFSGYYQEATVRSPVVGLVAPDVTVSTVAAVRAQAAAWIADWAGTVPTVNSRTITTDRVIGLNASVTDLDLSGLVVPNGRRIWVRGVGTFSDTTYAVSASVSVTGDVKFNNSTGMGAMLFMLPGGDTFGTAESSLHIQAQGSTNCAVAHCAIMGSSPSNPAGYNFESPDFAIRIIGPNTGFLLQSNLIGWAENALVTHTGTITDFKVIGNLFDWLGHDAWKNTSEMASFTFKDNWNARNISYTSGSGKHEDFIQGQAGSLNNGTITGNVHLYDSNRWYGLASGSNQSFFFGDGFPATNIAMTQNILATNTNAGWKGGSSDAGSTVTNNHILTVDSAIYDHQILGATHSYNFGNAGGGTGSLIVDTSAGTDFTAADPYWTIRQYRQGDNIGYTIPATGTAHHWDYSGTKVGAWSRLKEIHVDGLHPGNAGWPVAGPWSKAYNNGANAIQSGWTGTYNSDGNVVGS